MTKTIKDVEKEILELISCYGIEEINNDLKEIKVLKINNIKDAMEANDITEKFNKFNY